ncbi:hypothetical protein MPSI1_000926 [Malassezia psittaci]|uniref:Uncharacterized protein n=1 Tax=Malassezia psittaci TaxID=1821823 RepID=A0AAF0JDD2_9BASI|nr:hypothetical protein MPSI1_000926 [Malassezia psittaci]
MTRSTPRPEPESVKDRIKVMEPSQSGKRRESESDTVSLTNPQTYKGNPAKLRFEPVLGHVRSVPSSANHTAPAQLVEPFHREGEGSMLPIHAFFSRAEVLHWNNFQRQVAHRYGKEIPELDFDTRDEERVPEPRPHANETTHSAPDVPYPGLQDSIGWATLAAKEGRTDVHPDDTEAKAALTKHLSDHDAWNEPWKFDENLGAGSADPIVPIAGLSEEKTAQLSPVQRRRHRIRMFMLRNVFVPLILRALNVIVLSATMGIGARLRMSLVNNDAEQSVGLSPLFGQ